MKHTNNHQCHKTQELISGYLDQELTQQQNQRVRVHIDSCKQCHALYKDLKAMQESVGTLQYPECEEDKMEKILSEPVSKSISWIGWALLSLGLIAFMLFQVFTFYSASEVPLTLKVIVFLIEAGLLGLFLSVLRQRLIARKTDKYKNLKL